ncbi:MAG: DUF368 domain-containing protein [Nitriliruptorales bacterium]|nr:DUF368 domain-containing protein [Nitriliruptorales bacterium]
MRSPSRSPALHFAQGMLMGGADVIPGVSGGTVALIVGIYEALVGSIRALASAAMRVLRGDLPGARGHFAEVHWRLVLPLGGGIVVALGIGAAVIPALLENYRSQTAAVFFGLIAGSLIVPWRRIQRRNGRELTVAVALALVAFVVVALPPQTIADPPLIGVFGAAAIAICAMILPGVSGSFVLLVIGIYEPTLQALRNLDVLYVLVFVAGAAIGLGMFSKVLGYLLERHQSVTMAALVGLMAGSLRALWPWLDEDRGMLAPPSDLAEVAAIIALAVAGFTAVRLLVRSGDRNSRRAAQATLVGRGARADPADDDLT